MNVVRATWLAAKILYNIIPFKIWAWMDSLTLGGPVGRRWQMKGGKTLLILWGWILLGCLWSHDWHMGSTNCIQKVIITKTKVKRTWNYQRDGARVSIKRYKEGELDGYYQIYCLNACMFQRMHKVN